MALCIRLINLPFLKQRAIHLLVVVAGFSAPEHQAALRHEASRANGVEDDKSLTAICRPGLRP